MSRYITVMETNGSECESWYYFIKVDGNEDNIKHLREQIESFDWYVMGDQSAFDIEVEHTVSSTTAKEMTKLEVNSVSYHRKFDGTLKKIDLGFKEADSIETKMCKAFDILGYGKIENFLSDEDIDEEDLTDNESDESSSSDDFSSSDEDSSSDESSENKYRSKLQSPPVKSRIPPVL